VPEQQARRKVLFLCTHNSARSQMAEGLLRHLAGDRFEVMSAGTEATSVRPEATRAMAELGVDISGQSSKALERYLGETFDYVVTVCDDANETCPVFPGAKNRLHWSGSSGRCGMTSRTASERSSSTGAEDDGRLYRTRAAR
jgi:arsenate reductase